MKTVRSKDITSEYGMGGLDAVKHLVEQAESKPSKLVVRKALQKLHDRHVDCADLDAWFRETLGFGLNNRSQAGRQGLQEGEEKPYKVQCGRFGGPYLKVATSGLNRFKGQVVLVRLQGGEMRLRPG